MILEGRGLVKRFPWGRAFLGPRRWVHAVTDVTLGVGPAETLAVVGESGSGKTTTGRLLAGLEAPTAGEVWFAGAPVSTLQGDAWRRYRLGVQVVFQDSQASLNPRQTVEQVLRTALAARARAGAPARGAGKEDAAGQDDVAAVRRLLTEVGLEPPEVFLRRFPHQLSGGQRQRVNIARALAVDPEVIVADEAVSALDLSVRAQILLLLQRVQRQRQVAFVFISHDLAVVRAVAHRVAVMYLGRIVEDGPTEAVFRRPGHPYTAALLSATPVPDPRAARTRRRILLPGDPPSPLAPPDGCPFHPRCPMAQEICRRTFPPLVDLGGGQRALCHFAGEVSGTS
ncbi:MAG: ABC transporter ATP-binding protein [Armatimonadota bacterium]|nr:ABC transporter ATP-binding protein [Armatimonadota bacterium]